MGFADGMATYTYNDLELNGDMGNTLSYKSRLLRPKRACY